MWNTSVEPALSKPLPFLATDFKTCKGRQKNFMIYRANAAERSRRMRTDDRLDDPAAFSDSLCEMCRFVYRLVRTIKVVLRELKRHLIINSPFKNFR